MFYWKYICVPTGIQCTRSDIVLMKCENVNLKCHWPRTLICIKPSSEVHPSAIRPFVHHFLVGDQPLVIPVSTDMIRSITITMARIRIDELIMTSLLGRIIL